MAEAQLLSAIVVDLVGLVEDEQPRALAGADPVEDGLDDLGERIERAFRETLRSVDLLLPFDQGGRLAELHEMAGDLDREDTAEGVRVRGRVPATVAERFARFDVSENGAAADNGI